MPFRLVLVTPFLSTVVSTLEVMKVCLQEKTLGSRLQLQKTDLGCRLEKEALERNAATP
jgi:hypothetical protein